MMKSEDWETRRRERSLWRRWREERDARAREELLDLYMPAARRMARRYAGIAEPYDDLLQVASLGLLNAIGRFDPSRGIPFLGFAKPTIMGELKRHFRDKVWTVRVPRRLHDLILRIERASEELTVELGRNPTVNELSARLGSDPTEVLEALEVQHNRSPLALDRIVRDSDDEDGRALVWLGEEDPNYELAEDRLALHAAWPELADRDAEILRLRFYEDLPQAHIAERLGCSQMHVSRVLRRTLDGLRESMTP